MANTETKIAAQKRTVATNGQQTDICSIIRGDMAPKLEDEEDGAVGTWRPER